jgi:hypothetical protein
MAMAMFWAWTSSPIWITDLLMVFLCFGLLFGDAAPHGAPHRAALTDNGHPANLPLHRNTSPFIQGPAFLPERQP